MKKTLLFVLSFVILLSSVLMVASAVGDDLADDMFDDDENVTFDNGTTTTTKGGLLGALGNIGGDGVGDMVGGVIESVFQDNDVSQQVGNKIDGVINVFEGFDLGGLIPTTQSQTVGSNFFDTIDPAITGSFSSNLQQNQTASTPISSLNGENVDYNTTVNPYQKPTAQLNPGDKGDGVKWLQWVLIYTECGLQGAITGEYDDATAAAVKNLQLKYGLTVDGIATLQVIEQAEIMYNDYINGISQNTSNAPVVFNTAGNSGATDGNKNKPDTNFAVTAIIVVLVIVWIFAIAAVCIIVHVKRKNIKLSEDGNIEKTSDFSCDGKCFFSEKTELVSLNECFVVEDYETDEYDVWCQDAYAYCVVQTSAELYCKEDCAYGAAGEKISLNYAYYLVMGNENSQWLIADCGYPPAVPLV